jgi:IclR family acetate operon transcriptional repressor
MASVAAPVMDADGAVTAAVQVAGHQEDVPHERIESLGIEVQRAAFAVARRAL